MKAPPTHAKPPPPTPPPAKRKLVRMVRNNPGTFKTQSNHELEAAETLTNKVLVLIAQTTKSLLEESFVVR